VTLQYNNPLVDKDFLIELDAKREREVYAKIIALDFNESPVQQIEGRVTQGSVNVDGSSAVRRTCSLNLVGGKDLNINDFYWGLNNKFKLEIGLRNTVNTDLYPEIIWFPQGVYLITAFNTSTTISNYAISINGKDKMCLLNGEIGGSLTASIDFGVEEFYDAKENTTTFTPIPIEKIIREAVHFYAGEPYHNIVINDLEDAAVELLEYRGDEPLYLLRNSAGEFDNFTDNGDAEVCFAEDNTGSTFKISELEQKGGYYDPRVELAPEAQAVNPSKLKFKNSNNIYTVARIEYGQTVGYRQTELTYAGDLISNIGESITSILDKIKNMLGEFEYFYDLDGRFIFQKKKTYIQTSWNNIVKIGDEQYVDSAAHSSATTYRFEGNTLVTSFQNSPNLNNLRNDFAVWGEKKGVSGEAIPIHYRYAIDVKPERYVSITMSEKDLEGYNSEHPEAPLKPQESKEYLASEYDWRELIYQMANDYYKYNQIDSFYSKVIAANKPNYCTGTTGYEQYYSDIYSFWRQLYNSNPEPYYSDFNKRGDEETFTCVDAHENNIPLFIKGKYVKVANPKNEDSTVNIFALKEVSYSENSVLSTHKELIPWLEAIEIPYTSSFGSNPTAETESNRFYVVGPNDPNTGEATYKKVQYSIRNQLDKQELFVYENGKYV
jgi:hypothetical protein